MDKTLIKLVVSSIGLSDPKKSVTGTLSGSLLNKSFLTPTVDKQ